MRNFLILLFYTFFILLLGRNLVFIPEIKIGGQASAKDPDEIRDDVVNFLKEQKGDYSIYYEDLVTDESFSIYGNTVLTAASLNKLPIVGYLYHLASQKEIDLQETVVIQAIDIQDYGTGKLRYEEPGGTYTLQYLAQLAMNLSDNTAAHVLNIRLGEEDIQAYAYEVGMTATSMVDNDTTARDVGKFFSKLYRNEIANEALSRELLGYMEDTEFEDRLPSLLPQDLHIYHKTGDGVNFIHDGGIITNGTTPFVLVVLSSNISDEAKAKETIGKIAEIVYVGRGKK